MSELQIQLQSAIVLNLKFNVMKRRKKEWPVSFMQLNPGAIISSGKLQIFRKKVKSLQQMLIQLILL